MTFLSVLLNTVVALALVKPPKVAKRSMSI